MCCENDKITDDEKLYGKRWVFCTQHNRVHYTGWCTVSPNAKIVIPVHPDASEDEANEEWHNMRLNIGFFFW